MANETEQVAETTHTVVDNSNLEQVLAEARGEKYAPEEKKPEVKAEPAEDAEDLGLEGEHASDPKLTEIVRKAVNRKHRQYKEASEFGETQFEEKRQALKKLEAVERENARLKEQLTPKEEAPKKPVKADYKSDEEYIEAIADYKASEKIREREEQQHKAAQEERAREIFATAETRLNKAREVVPDYDEVIEAAPEINIANSTLGYMQESELFAEIGYYLAKNVEVYEKLSKMSPQRQLVEIGKIESTLKPFSEKSEEVKTGKPEPKTEAIPSINAKASKARPEPIKPLETGGASQVEKPEEEMNFQESFAAWQKSHKTNLRARRRH